MLASQNNLKTEADCLLLRARCEKLNRISSKDYLDPFLVVCVEFLNSEVLQVHRSLVVGNSFDPLFEETICIQQPLSSLLSVIFLVYNNDGKKTIIGKYKLKCGQLLCKSTVEGYLTRDLEIKARSKAKIIITREARPYKLKAMTLQFSCQKIYKSLWSAIFNNNHSYYFRVYESNSSNKAILYQSQKMKGQPYRWESFAIHQSTKSPTMLKIQLLCLNKRQEQQVVGQGELKTGGLGGQKEIIINNQSSKVATFVIEKYEVAELQPFESYLSRGLKIKTIVGIDFTASNGSYSSPKSLHHLYKGANIYQKTVQWIYNIFTPYNTSTSIPYYAVGTKVKHPDIFTGQVVQDCFPLNGQKNDHEIADLQDFHLQYKKLMPCLQFSGPFKLERILLQAKELCESERKKGCFTVLVVINDGTVGDMELAKKRLEELAFFPFFMIALGIKQAQYKELREIVKLEANRTSLDGKIMRRKLAAFTMVEDKQSMGSVLQTMMCSIAQYMDYQFKKTSQKFNVISVPQLQKEINSESTVE